MADTVLIFVEAQKTKLKKTAFELAAVATELATTMNASVEAVAMGAGLESAVEELGEFGVIKVHLIDSEKLSDYNVHLFEPLLEKLVSQVSPKVILGTASLLGKDLLPRLAAKLGVGMASDCTEIAWEADKLRVKRPVYAGKAFIDMHFVGKTPFIATLRPNVFAASKQSKQTVTVDKQSVDRLDDSKGKLVEVKQAKSEKADLTEADIIVSGGRSLKSQDNFKILFELAETLGATVGASRAAVDAGYASHDMQVGQTGKVVSPKLYMAFGISGAIQHLAGMRTSKVIVAINTDPEAPLFKKADYGIVGDLFELAPEINKAAKALLES